MKFPKAARRVVCGMLCLSAMFAFQRHFRQFPGMEYFTFELTPDWQESTEWVFARLMFPPGPLNGYYGRDGDWHTGMSLWTQDYPRADRHFSQAVRRLTRIHTRSVEQPVMLEEGDVYDWPWLYAVQVGEWGLTPDEGKRLPEVAAGGEPEPERHEGRDRAQDRAGEPDTGFGAGVVPERLRGDHRSHERDEHRRRGPDPLAAELEDVAELMEEEEQYEADGEEPAEDQLIGDDRDQHRGRGREQLQLGERDEDQLRLRPDLREQYADGAQCAADPLPEPLLAAGAGVDRLEVGVLVSFHGSPNLAPRLRGP